MRRTALAGAAVTLLAMRFMAQRSVFEVASIRINPDPAARPRVAATPNGQYTASATTLAELIRFAFGVRLSEIVGGAEWPRTVRFDVVARIAQPPSGGPDALRPFVRTLLEDRFRLRSHMESRESDAFVLTLANPGVLGPRLQPTAADCAAPLPRLTDGQRRGGLHLAVAASVTYGAFGAFAHASPSCVQGGSSHFYKTMNLQRP